MKRKLIMILMIGALTTLAVAASITQVRPVNKDAEIVDPGQTHTVRNRWVVIDSSTSADSEPSALAADERTYQAVVTAIGNAADTSTGDGEIAIYDIPRGWNRARFRCIGITDNSNVVYEIYFGTLGDGYRHMDSTTYDCELAYVGQLDFTIGQQVSTTSTYEMADTLTVTDGEWGVDWRSSSPGNDRVAEASIYTMGADLIVAVPVTVGSDCKLLGKGY